jgi:hypothetical protein
MSLMRILCLIPEIRQSVMDHGSSPDQMASTHSTQAPLDADGRARRYEMTPQQMHVASVLTSFSRQLVKDIEL